MKKIIDVLAISFIGGLILGLTSFAHHIITEPYIKLKLFRSAALCLQEHLNKWTVLPLLVLFGLFVFLHAAKLVWKLFFSKIIEVSVKDKNKLLVFVFCSAIFICVGWAINHYWLPNKFHPVSILADIGILLFSVLSGYVLTRIKWERLYTLKQGTRVRKAALILFLCFLLLNLSVNVERKFNARKLTTNVILISIDTLRADHLGCYGYDCSTSPNIDSFAKENTLFKNCFVHEPQTAPSHMSMLTGLYPVTHGVNRTSVLDKSRVTLAEVLKNEGYHTLAFVRECGQLRPQFGFARGFDVYLEKNHREFIVKSQNKVISKYLKESGGKKLFLFIHYYDVHSDWDKLPYDSPEPYNKMFYPDYQGDFTGGDEKLSATKYLKYVNNNNLKLKQDDLKYITALYDGGIAYTDECLGELFEELKKRGLYDKSLIIVTADHGEEFQEHGFMLHSSNPFYYDELVHVPLIVKLPGSSAGSNVVTKLVENIDIMPSILAHLGVKNIPKMHGNSFMKLIDDPNTQWKDYVFGYSSKNAASKNATRAFVRSDRLKLLTSDLTQKGPFKMFDLHSDPQEMVDIKNYPEGTAELLRSKLLGKYLKLEKAENQTELPTEPEQLKILKSLGYVD